jgi:hypothetical protein
MPIEKKQFFLATNKIILDISEKFNNTCPCAPDIGWQKEE